MLLSEPPVEASDGGGSESFNVALTGGVGGRGVVWRGAASLGIEDRDAGRCVASLGVRERDVGRGVGSTRIGENGVVKSGRRLGVPGTGVDNRRGTAGESGGALAPRVFVGVSTFLVV